MSAQSSKHFNSSKFSWEVLNLIAIKCDPKTLATASCVSKLWSSSMSSDHLWKSICTTHFPSLSNLHPSISYRRIYALGHASAKRRRQPPPQPRLSIDDLLFAVTIPPGKTRQAPVTILKPFNELENYPEGRFRFDVDMKDVVSEKLVVDEEEDDDMKMSSSIVMRGFESVFRVLDRKGKTSRREWWFTEELPSAGCCFCNGASGLLAEITLVFGETIILETGSGSEKKVKKKKVVDKVRIGVMNVVSTWRYASVDDTLRYLQHFLLPVPAAV
ncbi:putative F-box protein At5g04010 [Apium graveolens]|uniref:putative F-box protein At5g04010 n=1 Tax=Apium graveolens TaxID=4045 RepID=UPI003D799719